MRYNTPKNHRYTDSSTQWTKLRLNFTEENCGIRLIYDEIDSTHADICFSKITKSISVFQMKYENYFIDMFESIPGYRKIVL